MQAGACAIALTGNARSSLLPDVPTFAKAGFPQIQAQSWFGMFSLSGVPAPIVAKLSDEIAAAVATPAVRKQLEGIGKNPVGSCHAEEHDHADNHPSGLLKKALAADAVASGALAVLQIATPDELGRQLMLPHALLLESGVFLVLYTVLLVVLARSARVWACLIPVTNTSTATPGGSSATIRSPRLPGKSAAALPVRRASGGP